jgi:hypothetical protein
MTHYYYYVLLPLIYMNVHKKNLNQGIFPITTIYLQYASLQSEVVVVPNDASWLAEL